MIEQFDLTVARDRVGIPTTYANPIDSVTVVLLPDVSVFSLGNLSTPTARLHFRHGAQGLILNQVGQTFEPDPAEAMGGLFVSNDAFPPFASGQIPFLVLDITFVTHREPMPVIDVTRTPRAAPAGTWVDQLLRNFGLKR